jgi:hypothetical protein
MSAAVAWLQGIIAAWWLHPWVHYTNCVEVAASAPAGWKFEMSRAATITCCLCSKVHLWGPTRAALRVGSLCAYNMHAYTTQDLSARMAECTAGNESICLFVIAVCNYLRGS